MKIAFEISHPAHVHQFKYLYWELLKKGYDCKYYLFNKDKADYLVEKYEIKNTIIFNGTGKGYLQKIFIVIIGFLKLILTFIKDGIPNVIIGRSNVVFLIVAFFMRIKYIAFNDTEHERIGFWFTRIFANIILTPSCSNFNYGNKEIKFNTYKELWYLHPNRFTPNPEVLKEIGLTEQDKFFIVRFVSWEATHDVGQKSLSIEDKRKLIETLKPYGKIIISSEKELPAEFEEYRMTICPTKMHDLLYYATMYIGEGGTMASEAACLGTYSIYINPLEMGYTNEERDKYRLIFQSTNINDIVKHFNELDLEKLKKESMEKMKILLKDKIDVTEWMMVLIIKI